MKKILLLTMIFAQASLFAEPAADLGAQKEEKIVVQVSTSSTDENKKTEEEKQKEAVAQVTAQVLTAS